MKDFFKKTHMSTVIIAIVFFFLFTSFLGFYQSVRPSRIRSVVTPDEFGFIYEKVSFETQDGVPIRGWFIPRGGGERSRVPAADTGQAPSAETQKTIIALHGYPTDKGNILPFITFLNDEYNLLLFDFRYLGESGGKYSTAGAKEMLDLLAAIAYLKTRGIEEVGVWGFSVGGAVALMAQERAPEIHVVVSEAAYANLGDLAKELFQLPYLDTPLAFFTRLWGMVVFGIDANDVSPERSVAQSTIPILIIHSKNDEVISFSHALRIEKALENNPKAEFWFEDDLMHGVTGKGYEARVREFFKKHL